MKPHPLLFAGLVLLTTIALFAPCARAADPSPTAGSAPPEIIVIHSQVWPEKKYEDSKFPHKKHATELQITCKECHHRYENGGNVWKEGDPVATCESCHTSPKTGKALKDAPPEEQKLSLYNAFHRNCLNCHKEQAKGPTKCIECHNKKKQAP